MNGAAPALSVTGGALAAEAITPLTWSAIRDEARTCALLHYPRSDLNPARSSSVKTFGCSQAAK